MERTPGQSGSHKPRPLLSRLDQAAAAAIIALSLAIVGGWWLHSTRQRARTIDIEQHEPAPAAFALNLNRATWPELSLLPNVGETTARRIVADREANGPFLDINDLQRIKGIGPKTVARIRPYCEPMPSTAVVASP